MALDSSTLCARTSAGEAELATARQGLSLGQRRVLTLVQNPVAVDELAQEHRLEPDKLARDLTRLAELHLIVLQGPTIVPEPAAVAPESRAPQPESMAPVIIGHGTRRLPALPLVAGATALLLAVGVWYGTRTSGSTTAIPQPPVASSTFAPTASAPAPSRPLPTTTNDAVPVALAPGFTTVLRGNAAPPEPRPELRPDLLAAAPNPPKPAGVPIVPEPKATAASESPGAAASTAPTKPVPVATAEANAPAPGPNIAADAAPPIQLAAAAPTAITARPAVAAELRAISRDAPDFPKEAIADGFRSGIVNARIHVDARGNVAGVDIVGSQPPKVFDRAVRKALMRWQFEPNAAGNATDLDVDIKFQRD